MSSELKYRMLEVPLNQGFRRCLIKRETDKLVSAYYLTPNNEYLKDVSEVCDWIEKQTEENIISRRNFNFVAKKLTSHINELVIDFDILPNDIRDYVIQKKRSVAPNIVTLDNEDTLSVNTHQIIESNSRIPRKRIKMSIDLEITDQTPTENNNLSQTVELNSTVEDQLTLTKNAGDNSKDAPDYAKNTESNDPDPLEADDESTTLSVASPCDNTMEDVLQKYRQPFEYPLATINMNILSEKGTHCHINRIIEALDTDVDTEAIESMISYCGIHCAFDSKGFPRVAFECDICLVMWHNDCTGHRLMTVGPVTLIICDNCHLLRKNLSVHIWNTFCDIETLLQEEFQPESNVTKQTTPSIPLKLEPIFKLCKVQWILQNKTKPADVTKTVKPKGRPPGSKNVVRKEVSMMALPHYRYFMTIYITPECIFHDFKEDVILLKYTMKDIDRMANLFADAKCEMLINNEIHNICTARVTVRDGVLSAPLSSRVSKNGYAMFFTVEDGQDSDPDYINRYGCLKSTMCTNEHKEGNNINTDSSIQLQRKDTTKNMSKNDPFLTIYKKVTPTINVQSNVSKKVVQNQLVHKEGSAMKTVNFVTQTTRPVNSFCKVIPTRHLMTPSPEAPIIKAVSSLNLPKSIASITHHRSQNSSNIVKIKKRKEEIFVPNVSSMTFSSSMIQYYHLVDLPFSILERIVMSRNLSTIDRLNCRLVNRAMRCVVDGGRVWNKVRVNPCLITGLQAMFDFFSIRSVQKMTFAIDFKDSFDIEFFTSFISRLKLYPDSFHLQSISVKLTNLNNLPRRFTLFIQDILSGNKLLKRLSVASDSRIIVSMGKNTHLRSDSLESLKLTNVDNIPDILRTQQEHTPKLRRIHCGDWSRILSMEIFSLAYLTSLRMEFSGYVNFTDATPFALLRNLEHLTISRPGINETLKKLLSHILTQKSLKYFLLETEVSTTDQLCSCPHFGSYLPLYIDRIQWNIYVRTELSLSESDFKRILSDVIHDNVRVNVIDM